MSRMAHCTTLALAFALTLTGAPASVTASVGAKIAAKAIRPSVTVRAPKPRPAPRPTTPSSTISVPKPKPTSPALTQGQSLLRQHTAAQSGWISRAPGSVVLASGIPARFSFLSRGGKRVSVDRSVTQQLDRMAASGKHPKLMANGLLSKVRSVTNQGLATPWRAGVTKRVGNWLVAFRPDGKRVKLMQFRPVAKAMKPGSATVRGSGSGSGSIVVNAPPPRALVNPATHGGHRLLHGSATQGPYAHLIDHKSVGPGKAFTRAQKERIKAENRLRNNGYLRDDDTGERLTAPTRHRRGVTPPRNEAHIDHVAARSKGGSNSHGNAAVLSGERNIEKQAGH